MNGYWNIGDDLSLIDAAALICDRSPTAVDSNSPVIRPTLDLLLAAVERGVLPTTITRYKGSFEPLPYSEPGGGTSWNEHASLDAEKTRVRKSDLKDWLSRNGTRPAFFFPGEMTDSRQPQHPVEPIYSTPWIEILHSAIAEFFHPRHRRDPKREEVVDWIQERAMEAGIPDPKTVAGYMFTIIKPTDHNPRTKR